MDVKRWKKGFKKWTMYGHFQNFSQKLCLQTAFFRKCHTILRKNGTISEKSCVFWEKFGIFWGKIVFYHFCRQSANLPRSVLSIAWIHNRSSLNCHSQNCRNWMSSHIYSWMQRICSNVFCRHLHRRPIFVSKMGIFSK